jgi:hypothetical protein
MMPLFDRLVSQELGGVAGAGLGLLFFFVTCF